VADFNALSNAIANVFGLICASYVSGGVGGFFVLGIEVHQFE